MDQLLRPIRSEKVKWQVIDEEGILVNLETGYYFSLNAVALYIWDMCDGEHALEQIADGLVGEFDVDAEMARRDMDGFVQQLAAESLIEFLDPEIPNAG